ncbi:MAG: Vms1/Ankzf1 family peptidyl-tRNA hydrolase [Candidatus Lernaella stagnicola]|nr:Vms1/Ankzf1 family peptidyl-tRNA hydrolase [Candidatus Lernaella stagnicola]
MNPMPADLRELAELVAPTRSVLTVYLSPEGQRRDLEKRLAAYRELLAGERPESQDLAANVARLASFLDERAAGTAVLFVAAASLDYFRGWTLPRLRVPMVCHVDSTPLISPLAETFDEFENYAVVVADNRVARIFLVAGGRHVDESRVRGDIKNHVRKGGWSQQRYERRRDKQIGRYADEVVEHLRALAQAQEFSRLVLVGGKEAVAEIDAALPHELAGMVVGEKALDLRQNETVMEREIFDLVTAAERSDEADLWRRIKGEYLRGGLAVAGGRDVLDVLRQGRAAALIVNRDSQQQVSRCGDCGATFLPIGEGCPACNSSEAFDVPLIEAVTELAVQTGAEVEYADPIPALAKLGEVAALLRW